MKHSKPEKGSPEYVVDIDWDSFDPEQPQFLDKIPAKITEREPEKFIGKDSGTYIEITDLREPWVRGQVREMHRDINSICSPFGAPRDFRAVLSISPQADWLSELFSFRKVEDYALFSATCVIDGNSWEYKYSMKAVGALKDRVEGRKNDQKLRFSEAGREYDSSDAVLPAHRFSLEELEELAHI